MSKFLLSIFFIFSFTHAQSDFFDFSEESFKEDALVAKEDDKKAIMIFFSMAECPFCHKMEKKVFSQKDIEEYYKENFAIFEVDIDGAGIEIEDFQGNETNQKEFAFKNRVKATPVIAFFDLEGNKIFTRTGYTNKKDFKILGEYIASGAYKTENFVRYKRAKLKK